MKKLFMIRVHSNCKEFISDSLDSLKKGIDRLISSFLDWLQLKLKVKYICSSSRCKPFFMSVPDFLRSALLHNHGYDRWGQSWVEQREKSFISLLPCEESWIHSLHTSFRDQELSWLWNRSIYVVYHRVCIKYCRNLKFPNHIVCTIKFGRH